MSSLTLVFLACAAIAAVLYALGIGSTFRHLRLRRRAAAPSQLPPLSLLKPIKGLEEDLEQNLRTFFEQDYPAPIEIVFSAETLDDPGLAIARVVASEFPEIPTRFVRSDVEFGLNPKVANLAGAMAAARHDLVFQSDANVRIRPGYLRRVVQELLAEEGSILSSIVVGVGERSVGAALENLQLTALIGPSVCTALHVGRTPCVIGKSMLMRRSELESVGGLEAVRDVLCEDFILGQRYQGVGKRVLVSTETVENVNRHTSIERFLGRHSRWLKMRAVIHFGSFLADLFANPIFWSLAACVSSGFAPPAGIALAASLALKLSGDLYFMRALRPDPMPLRYLLLGPPKDILMAFVWAYSLFSRSVVWRGRRLRFGKESRLRPDPGNLPRRVARRLLTAVR